MSLTYKFLFAGPSPDLHPLLDQLVDEHLEETPDPITEDNYFYFYESDGNFHLYYNEDNELDAEHRKPMLLIYPHTRPRTYTLAFGEFNVVSDWYIDTNNTRNMAKADEALARLLRGVLTHYEGDFVCLFNGERVILYRTGGRVYLNESSDIAQEPMVSLLGLKGYELRAYEIV